MGTQLRKTAVFIGDNTEQWYAERRLSFMKKAGCTETLYINSFAQGAGMMMWLTMQKNCIFVLDGRFTKGTTDIVNTFSLIKKHDPKAPVIVIAERMGETELGNVAIQNLLTRFPQSFGKNMRIIGTPDDQYFFADRLRAVTGWKGVQAV